VSSFGRNDGFLSWVEEEGERQRQNNGNGNCKSKGNCNGKSNRRSFDSPFAKMREQLRSG
jgi:hypothetical protein